MTARSASPRFTRRQFVKATDSALAAGVAARSLLRARGEDGSRRREKTLRILQWSHFVPGYDAWFDGVYTKEWGAKNGTEVIVDHMATTEINARGAAEAAAKKGHDLFLFISPPAAYENQVIDHRRDRGRRSRSRHGKMIPLAREVHAQSEDREVLRVLRLLRAGSRATTASTSGAKSDTRTGPNTCEDLRIGGRKIKEKFGNPVGIGLSQEMDSNMALRGVLWSFGGAEQDAEGRVVLHSPETIEALKYMRALYRETDDAGGLHLGSGLEQPDDAGRAGRPSSATRSP